MGYKHLTTILAFSCLLAACGGGGSSSTVTDNPSPSQKIGTLTVQLDPTVALIGVPYTTSTYRSSGKTSNNGTFEYKEGESVSFTIAGIDYTLLIPGSTNNEIDLVGNNSDVLQNLKLILNYLDADDDPSNGIDLNNSSVVIDPTLSITEVTKILYKSTGDMPELPFSPSLGINTEAPQGGADTAGMPMPFVDIFRTARPFTELSPAGTQFDANGWPTEFATGQTFARTKLLQGALDNSIPEGKYTVLYDDSGKLEFGSSGTISNVKKVSGENKYTFDLNLRDFDGEDEVAASDTNAFNMNIRDIASGSGNYMRNIRIIMPGGTCSGNPYIRFDSAADCPNGTTYQSFEERLKADRNEIIFNPDYLMFLRNFKVVRMMNLMEASLKKLCYTAEDCPAEVGTWENRAKLDDAVWGGNDGRTPDENHKGVPVEVMITLANTLKRDIWVNMPHIASDDYVSQFAQQVYAELDPSIKVYLEYSNEVWNNGFAGHAYATSEGKKLGLDTVPEEFVGYRDSDYFARLRFYSQRAVQIFKLWETKFGGSNSRIVRVLGSFIGDKVLTEQMLRNITTNDVDAVAIAPYFFGCPYKDICIDAPMALNEATTVDDIFDTINQSGDVDVKSLEGTINAVKNQLTIISLSNLKLVSYEGGQHLVTGIFGSAIDESDQARYRKLFNQANRDPRMKEIYINFLNAWKDLSDEGTSLFTLYTLPQSFYRYGNFGLKEHLNKSRSESPKYDGVMTFQEAAKECWWDNCE